MAVVCTERMESREETTGDGASALRRYVITGTADYATAKTALGNGAPLLHGSLVRRSRNIAPIFVDTNDADHSIWAGEARYGLRQRTPDMGDSTFSFDTSGGTKHIMQSLETRGTYPAPDVTAEDYKGAIQLTRTGQGEITVEGTDISVPVYSWTETHYLANAFITAAYKADLKYLTAKLNDQTWRGYARGEVLFMGARGSVRSSEDWEISFSFAASDNISGEVVGDITGIAKGGWDHMWFEYGIVPGDKLKVMRARVAYVERVYRYRDFSLLGLGI